MGICSVAKNDQIRRFSFKFLYNYRKQNLILKRYSINLGLKEKTQISEVNGSCFYVEAQYFKKCSATCYNIYSKIFVHSFRSGVYQGQTLFCKIIVKTNPINEDLEIPELIRSVTNATCAILVFFLFCVLKQSTAGEFYFHSSRHLEPAGISQR